MAILNHGSTLRTADGGQTTTTIVTAANIGTYGVATNSTYYVGTTQNIFNRASGAQTLTGVSIDGNAATVTNGVYTTGAQTIGGTKTFSDGVIVNGATYYAFNKPTTNAYQTVALFGSASAGLFLTTDSAIIGVGSYYNNGWIATATSGRQIDFAGGNFTFNAFSGATVGGAASWGTVAQLSSAGVFSATGDFRAPIFYDSNNTAYYCDPASTSVLNALTVGGESVLTQIGITFTPSGIGWYRILTAGGISSGTIRVSGFYDNRSATIEFDYTVNGWGNQCYATVRNNNNYSVGLITQIRVSNDGGASANSYLDIYIASSTTPAALTVVNFGPIKGSLVSSPVVGATAGTSNVKTISINNVMGIVTTGVVNATSSIISDAIYLGDATTYISQSTPYLKITNANGYGTFGSGNASFFHMTTDRPTFYMSTALSVNGDIFVYNTQSQLTSTSVRAPIFYDSGDTTYYLDPANTGTSLLVAGKVGIGTTSPLSTLSLSGAGPTILTLATTSYPSTYLTTLGVDTSARGFLIFGNNGENQVRAGRTSTGGYLDFYTNNTVDQTTLASNGNFVMRLAASGSVGIGTTTPSQKLDVSGAINASTYVYAGVFYDNDNTVYYTNPSGTSNLVGLTVANTITGSVSGSSASCTGNAATASLATTSDRLTSRDNRTISPSQDDASKLRFGFTSYSNNNTGSWADYLHLRSYADGTGGNDNLVMFNKNAIGMRIWQQAFGSATAYATYKDVAFTDQGFYIGTTSVAINRSSASQTLTGVSIDGNAATATNGLTTSNYVSYSAFTGAISSGGAITATSYIYTSTYLQTGGNLIYPSTYGATQRLEVSNSANNSWIDGLTIAPGGTVTAPDNMRSPIFYDSNNTAYYLDPASTSVINRIDLPSGSAAINTTTPGTSAYQLNFTGQSTADYAQAITWGWSTSGAEAGIYVQSSGAYGTKMYIATTDSFVTGSKTAITIDHTGVVTTNRNYLQATGSLRAPIFYDSDNTAYYIDAASTSNLVGLTVANTITGSVSGNAGTATVLQTARNINGTSFNGSAAITTASWGTARTLTIGSTGKSVDGSAAVSWSLAEIGALPLSGGQITGNTTFSADNHLTFGPNSTWGSSIRIGGNGYTATGTETASVCTTDGNLHLDGAKSTNGIYLNWYGGTSGVFFGNGSSGQVAFVSNAGNASFSGVVDATQFRDASNTGYYLDPAGNSQVVSIYANDWFRAQGNTGLYFQDKGYGITSAGGASNSYGNASTYGTGLNGWQGWGIGSRHCMMSTGADNFGVHDNTRGWLYYWNGTYHNFQYGYLESASSVRAPLFYDSNDTTYYLDPANSGTSLLVAGKVGIGTTSPGALLEVSGTSGDGVPTFKVTSTAAAGTFNWAGTILNSSLGSSRNFILFIGKAASTKNAAYIGYNHSGTDGSNTNFLTLGHYASDNLLNILGNGNVGIGTTSPSQKLHVVGTAYSDTDFRAPIFYDSNDTTYYLDPNSNSILLDVEARGGINLRRDLSTATGISFYATSYYNWQVYMAPAAATGCGANGNLTAPNGLTNVSSWALRSRMENVGSYGWLWELGGSGGGGPTATSLMELDTGGILTLSGQVRVPIFYDRDNTAYYVDPNSTSNLVGLTVANTITGSVSGNSGTVGGLSVHSGRNNEVNKVVRTDGSGYIQAGWINTDSGDSGFATRLTRITCSTDNYLRYLGLTDFKVSIGESAKNNYSRRVDYSSNADYHVGSFGHNGYGANETFHGGSGFIDIWAGTNYPSGLTHIHGFNALHYTVNSLGTTGGSAYGWQMVAQYDSNSGPWWRRCSNGSFSSWLRLVSYGNNQSGTIYASDFYDNDNTAYYINPASASSLNTLTMAGIITTVSTGTAINFSGQSDSIGYNATAGQGTYIKGTGTTYIYGGGVFFDGSAVRTLLHSNNYNSYSPTLTGTGASGTWSINVTGNASGTAGSISGYNNPTTAATANTIVYRDANGHIFGNYILGGYFNSSAGNSENPTIGQIWTQSTADNYLRKSTPAHFRSQVTDGSYPSLTGANASGTWNINITGNANNITQYTVNQSVGTANTPTFSELTLSGVGMGAYNFMKYSGLRSGDWQTFTTTEGQLNVIQVNNITGGGHTNYPTGVYPYGAVMSWKTTNHSFQLYAAHTGDLAYKTQWNNDNNSGWRRILDSTNYPYAANMNQYVRTTDNVTHNIVDATQFRDSNDTSYYLDLNSSGSLIRGRVNITGGHGGSSLRVFLSAAENGATTGVTTLQQWCSEPGNSWDGAGFGYNVDNSLNEAGNVPVYYFGRPNTSFGQAYMRMTTDGNWYFYNTPNGSNTRHTTMVLDRTGYVLASNSIRSPIFHDSDNTVYYTDPGSTSNLLGLTVVNTITGSITGNAGGSSASCTGNSATTTLATKATRANGNFYIDDNYGNTVVGVYSASRYQGVFAMGDSYKLVADGSTTGNLYGIAWSHQNAGGAAANLASHGLLILENGVFKGAWGGGSLRTPGDVRGTLFYDWDNTGYYVDPASTSNLAGLTVANTISGSITGSAGSVAWTNVSGRPTAVSSFSNDSGYITSGGSISGSSGSCTGNAASVTDGVYLSTNQSISGVKTFSSAPVATNIAKAWVHYNMNNNTINASYNVSSVTDNGTGVCTVNFSTSMVDANYVVAGTATYGYDDQDIYAMILAVPRRSTAQQAGSCRLATEFIHGAQVYDCVAVRAVFYR